MQAKKILLLGAQAVGKTSIARRMKFNTFEHDYKSTLGVQLHEVKMHIGGELQAVVLWDTDGNFGDKIFESVYVKGASAALVVADSTRPHTIDHMLHLIQCFEQTLPGRPCYGLLNKCDLLQPNECTQSKLDQQVNLIKRVSACTGQGLQQAIQSLLETCNRRNVIG
jgi:small GTP-binding protein